MRLVKGFPLKILEETFLFLTLLFVITLPFSMRVNTLLIPFVGAAFIFTEKRTNQNRWEILFLISITCYFLIFVIGVFYSSDTHNAWFQVEKRLQLAVFPIIFFFKKLNENSFKRILQFFIIGLVLASILCLVLSTISFIQDVQKNPLTLTLKDFFDSFSYDSLAGRIQLHPTYFSLFLLLAISLKLKNAIQWKDWFIIILFTIMILLLLSRIAIIAAILVGVIKYKYAEISPLKNRLKIIGIVFLATMTTLTIISPIAFKRGIYDYSQLDEKNGQISTGITMRLVHWKASFMTIRSNFPFGVGTGDTQTELDKSYLAINQNTFLGMDSHCQYIYDMIALGIPGLVALLILLILPVHYCLRQKDFEFLSFIIIIQIFCLTESILDVNKGISFFAFFFSLFAFHRTNETKVNTKSIS